MAAPDQIHVTLETGEWEAAVAVGVERHRRALIRKQSADWRDGTELAAHIRGALAEAAYHKWRGQWWHAPIDNGKAADAEGEIQIRSTSHLRPFHKVKPTDPDSQRVVFIESQERTHIIVGWIQVKEAKKLALEDPGDRDKPVHHVYYEDMHSVGTLE